MHLAFGECDEVKRKGLEIMGWVRYSTIKNRNQFGGTRQVQGCSPYWLNWSILFAKTCSMMYRRRVSPLNGRGVVVGKRYLRIPGTRGEWRPRWWWIGFSANEIATRGEQASPQCCIREGYCCLWLRRRGWVAGGCYVLLPGENIMEVVQIYS